MSEHQDRLLIGMREIAAYVGRSPRTIYRWMHNGGLPVAPLPSGERATSRNLIDNWLLARARVEEDRRHGSAATSRSDGSTAE